MIWIKLAFATSGMPTHLHDRSYDGCASLLTFSPMCVTALLFSLIKSLCLTKRLGTWPEQTNWNWIRSWDCIIFRIVFNNTAHYCPGYSALHPTVHWLFELPWPGTTVPVIGRDGPPDYNKHDDDPEIWQSTALGNTSSSVGIHR